MVDWQGVNMYQGKSVARDKPVPSKSEPACLAVLESERCDFID